ncbi:hypothetical protein ACOMHN_044028 [Nucella lapillus]
MADLSLDDIIAKKQGNVLKKPQPLNQNVRKQFKGNQGVQQKPFKPGFVPKAIRLGGPTMKRHFSAPRPNTKNAASPMKPRGAQTPNSGTGLGGPGKGQIDARDMITIKTRIKMGDARAKIMQKRLNKVGQPQQRQIPPPAGPRPQGFGPGLIGLGPGLLGLGPGGPPQPFAPQQQAGFQPPPRPMRPPGPQGFQPLRQQGGPFQQPRPVLEPQGPRMNQPRPPQLKPPFPQQQRPFNPQHRPPFQRPQKPFNQPQRPPFNQQPRPPFNQLQIPPFNQPQGPPFEQNQPQGPPFEQPQGPPFDQQQGPPFGQPQGPFDQQQGPFDQQGPFNQQQGLPFDQQPTHFNPNPQQFDQPAEFNEQPADFDQPPPDFIQEQCDPQFGQEQVPPFGQEQIVQFNPEPQFDPQFNPQGPPPEEIQIFWQQDLPGQQFNQQGQPQGNPLQQMNQPPPNLMQMPPGPGRPPNFNHPPKGFNPQPNLNQPPPEFIQPGSDMSQPPPGFGGQAPPGFNAPPPGFHPGAFQEGEEVGLTPMQPVEKTVVEDTGVSLRITRTIPEVSFDGENLTVTRRVPPGSQMQTGNFSDPNTYSGSGTQSVHFSASRPPPPQPLRKKFQPIPVKAPTPPKNTVKTGGPTLSTKARVSSTGQDPVRPNPLVQSLGPKPFPGRPVPLSSVNIEASNFRTAKMETAPAFSAVSRTLNKAPEQPSRLRPPPQALTSGPPPQRPSALSRIQLPNRNAASAFSRIDQQPPNIKISMSRMQQQIQGASALSRLSAPSAPVTKRLAPHPTPPPPPQPARAPQMSVSTRVSQATGGARMAVKRPSMSLSERFSSGSSGNPIPVITDHAPVKRRRPSEPELERADFGAEFANVVEEQFQSREEPGVPLLSPLQGYRVLVSNLHSTVTQDDIIELFGALGPLKRVNLLTKGQAEVAFIHKEHSVSALKTYHNRELDGQPMFVKVTTPLNAKVMQPPSGEDSAAGTLPATLRTKKPPPPGSAPVEIPLIHKALFKASSADGTAPAKAVRFTVKL